MSVFFSRVLSTVRRVFHSFRIGTLKSMNSIRVKIHYSEKAEEWNRCEQYTFHRISD